jgi:2-aminoadipate transaminase
MNHRSEPFSMLARRAADPPISWLMKLALDRPGLISLAAGFTDNETLPVSDVAEITRDLFADKKSSRQALQYGSTIGLPELRRQLLSHWRRQDHVSSRSLSDDDVIVTNGSQQLLHLVSETLCDSGDIVLMEDPTYFVFLGIVEALGIRPAGFTDVVDLEKRLEALRRKRQLSRLKMLYLVTYYRNPTGHTWTLESKREALNLVKHYERAAGHKIYILEDAAYRDLRFEGDDVPSFKSLDTGNQRVIYANTLTKPFATGIKLGYGILPAEVMRTVLRLKGNQDFGSSNLLQTIMARVFAEGRYVRHLPTLASAYRAKRDVMCEAIRRWLPANVTFEKPGGGLYVWARLPEGERTGVDGALFRRAVKSGVLYVPGEMCYCRDETRPAPRNFMRLSYGSQNAAGIRRGIRLLGEAIRK